MNSRRQFLTLFGAGALSGCGAQAQTGTAVATVSTVATLPAPPAVEPAVIPSAYQLFGPVQLNAAMSYVLPPFWQFPGSALTPNSKLIRFDMNVARARSARFRVSWTTESVLQAARLVHFDDGPTNITEMKVIPGRGDGLQFANNQIVDVTDEWNALRGGPYKNIGMQLLGDGVSLFAMWEARIEVEWEVR